MGDQQIKQLFVLVFDVGGGGHIVSLINHEFWTTIKGEQFVTDGYTWGNQTNS